MVHKRIRFPRTIGALAAVLALAALTGTAAAQDLIKLKSDQAAIIFVVSSQGRSGDIEVRAPQQSSPVWATLLSQASVRQFTVRPGAYNLDLQPGTKPVAIAAVAGRATIISLSGDGQDGTYRRLSQSEVAPDQLDQTVLLDFIGENRIEEAGYAPTSLDASGAGLTFVFRADL
jgi:hypothetical protein